MRKLGGLVIGLGMALLAANGAPAAEIRSWPGQAESDFIIRDFKFASGETLPELKIHYTTLGTPRRNNQGEVLNAVLLLHGTSGTGRNWLQPASADELFGNGQALDASQYFIILPDGIGRGGSSKPSNGLRMQFPHYRYRDIVEAEHRLVIEGLKIPHLRLVLGASMGGMHCWMWAEMYPGLMDAVVPIASQPVAVTGRNWLYRKIGIEAIRHDPDWNNGNYAKNPSHYIYTAPFSSLMTESPVRLGEVGATREAADAQYRRWVEAVSKSDANDTLYATEAVMDYDPAADIGKIRARLLAINFADDEVNPPELHTVEPAVARLPNARYVLIPASEKTHGHFTYNLAATWQAHLAEFMKALP
ncbi:MAG TPA: alpha/beta fold hydrolase [Burkholderiales bacterium]|nr:alpha/beta fold hydrolase [Burkholderiales bacterium]